MKKTQVLIADSSDIFRQGMETILSGVKKVHLAGSITTGSELIAQFKKYPKSLCMISSNIADSNTNIHDLMQKLKEINPEVSVIVLTNNADLSHLNRSLEAGVKGYLTKNSSAEELIEAVTAVANGKQAFGKSITQLMIGTYADQAKKAPPPPRKRMTKREKEILQLIVEGHTSTEIAKTLFISPRTVEKHRSNLMNKLGLKNTAALVRYAIEEEGLS